MIPVELAMPPSLSFRPADSDTWEDLEALFEARGGPKNCWCMVWRGSPADRRNRTAKKKALKQRALSDEPLGLIAYADDEPVGWVSIAPRSSYRPLGGPDEGEDAPSIWSLVCFYLARKYRGRGWLAEMLQAAINHAKKHGAAVVEAYPVAPDSPSYRFMGFVPFFEDAGFEHVGSEGSRRQVMRLELG